MFIKKWHCNTVTWDELFENYDYSTKNDRITAIYYDSLFLSHDGHMIEKLKPVLKALDCNEAFAFFNLTSNSETWPEHKDDYDVIYWQCIGKTLWKVEGYGDFMMEPGDLIYIPKGTYHRTVSITPRLGFSMAHKKDSIHWIQDPELYNKRRYKE
jgi:mannose-6-phosphate isomerase-like protein (cupin superfamily)